MSEAREDVADLNVENNAQKQPDEKSESDQFSSRYAYWLAAIGCSVGFGNVWRFPYMVFDYGGAVFFIPYISMLILVVGPVALLEFGLGQYNQCGLIAAFNALNPRTRGSGWGFMISFQVLQYYPLLLCWSLIYMINSARKDLPWDMYPDLETQCSRMNQIQCATMAQCVVVNNSCQADATWPAFEFFINGCGVQVDHSQGVEGYSWQVLLGWIFTYGCAFLGLAGGAKILGYMTYVTMTMPAFFLILLVGVGAAQEGAVDGIIAYVGKIDFNELGGDVWASALAQAIFSMGAMQGSMCGYAAHNKREQNFVQDVAVVMLGDTLFAFFAGFAVFSIAGHLAFLNDMNVEDLQLSGTSLVFQTYPVGLGQIPAPGAQILNFLFFLTLFLLGFSTVVGLAEAVIMPLSDSRFVQGIGFLKNKSRLKITGFVCTVWTLFGFIYATDMGKHFLDCLDEFSAEVSSLLIAYLYGVSAWFIDHENQRRKLGETAFWTFFALWQAVCWAGAVLNVALTKQDVGAPNTTAIALGAHAGLIIIFGAVAFVVPLFLVKDKNMSMNDRAYSLYMDSPNLLRKELNNTSCKGYKFWKVPLTWVFLLKYFIPIVGSLLWLRGVTKGLFDLGSGPIVLLDGTVKILGPYPWYVFVVACTPIITDLLAIVGFIYPSYMDFMLPPKETLPYINFGGPDAKEIEADDSPATTNEPLTPEPATMDDIEASPAQLNEE
eukprot:GHVP01028270.1.p1 GENE.GHVP01028270.1~~GHVP01028270.1.p1  ORF type:complete len:732 (-),score=70.23 GHVP01028270.1:167-2323(-)